MKCINSKILKKLETYFEYAKKRSTEIVGSTHESMSKPVRLLLTSVVVSMVMTRSVVYDELAEELNEQVELSSNVRRIQRLIGKYQLSYVEIAILTSLLLPKGKWEMSLDRTNWEYGANSLNILAVTVWVKGVGVPIWFELLDNKGGNSDQAIRTKIFDKIIKLFGVKRIGSVSGDREFIGERWVSYLAKKKLKFCLRIKQDTLVRLPGQLRGKAAYKWMHKKQTRYLTNVEIYGGLKVNMALKPLKTLKKDGTPDQLLLITNAAAQADKGLLEMYKKRWSIEVFFQCIKSRGFNLERTHLTQPERLKKLFAAVCLAFVCCLVVGIDKDATVKKIKLCKHGYKRKSFFRCGLDELRSILRKASRGNMELLEHFLERLCSGMMRLPDVILKKAAI